MEWTTQPWNTGSTGFLFFSLKSHQPPEMWEFQITSWIRCCVRPSSLIRTFLLPSVVPQQKLWTSRTDASVSTITTPWTTVEARSVGDAGSHRLRPAFTTAVAPPCVLLETSASRAGAEISHQNQCVYCLWLSNWVLYVSVILDASGRGKRGNILSQNSHIREFIYSTGQRQNMKAPRGHNICFVCCNYGLIGRD